MIDSADDAGAAHVLFYVKVNASYLEWRPVAIIFRELSAGFASLFQWDERAGEAMGGFPSLALSIILGERFLRYSASGREASDSGAIDTN
jgi:hypothetical protein